MLGQTIEVAEAVEEGGTTRSDLAHHYFAFQSILAMKAAVLAKYKSRASSTRASAGENFTPLEISKLALFFFRLSSSLLTSQIAGLLLCQPVQQSILCFSYLPVVYAAAAHQLAALPLPLAVRN